MQPWKLFLLCVCALLLMAGCSPRKEILPTPESAVLRSITVSANTLVLSEGESAELPFTVSDAACEFNYAVGTPACQVKLMLSGGREPQEFYLKDVFASHPQGTYVAVIADAGTGMQYDVQACIAIVLRDPDTGAESVVKSAAIHFKAEFDRAGDAGKTGLPVVFVDTEGGVGIHSKTEYVTAELSIRGNAQYEGLEPVPCSIRGRGNTTWTWPKKPYLIKLDSKASILGMPKHKRWVLLANFMDRTLMRNLVSMHVASMTSLAWTPRCVPVELVLNGKHQGSYLLIEQVRVDKNRVNISEEEGYLLELDFHYDNTFQWVDPRGHCGGMSGGIPFAVKSPDPDDLTAEQKTYIKNYIKEVSTVIYGNDFKDPEKGYAKYLDVDSFIDEWIVYEVMCNHELGNPGSVFFHKDKDGLLKAGPVWDFDWGVLSFYTSNGANGLVNGKAIWYARLFQDPAFKQRVKARFQELLPQLETIPDYMDECESLLEKSAGLNFAMWNPADDRSQNGGNIINGDENMTFHDAIARLKSNYRKHLQVIQKSL